MSDLRAESRKFGFEGFIYILIAATFSLSRINFFNMIFIYIGLGAVKTQCSVALYVIIDILIGIYFLKVLFRHFNLLSFVSMLVMALLYGSVYVFAGEYEELLKYSIFVGPVFLSAYICFFDEDGLKKLFAAMGKFVYFMAFMGIVYIAFLWIKAADSSSVAVVEGMSYGDIAFTFVPYFIYCVFTISHRHRWYDVVCFVIISAAICYTGLRTAIISLIFTCLAAAFFWLCSGRKSKKPAGAAMLAMLMCICICFVCSIFLPSSSRLSVTSDDFLYEVHELDNDQLAANYKVWNVETEQEETLREAFMHYAAEADTTLKVTERSLRRDILSHDNEKILVNNSQVQAAGRYSLHLTRVVLWDFAIREFMKEPVFGIGPYAFTEKYDRFPHNVILEILAETGITGLILIGGFFLFLIIRAVILLRRRALSGKSDMNLELIIFAFCFIPKHLLYTGLYSNDMLALLFIVLTFTNIRFSRFSASKALKK